MKLKTTLACILLTGCAHVGWDTVRVPNQLSASTYNDVANKYMQRPTSSSLITFKNGESYLAITMDGYGKNNSEVRFTKEGVPDYLKHIDKYLQWEQQAKSGKELLNKDIGKAKMFAGTLKFVFHSGNIKEHYLVLRYFGLDLQFYDRENAIKLRKLLSDFGENKITNVDIKDKYL